MKLGKNTQSDKPYVGDTGRDFESRQEQVAASFGMVLFSLIVGFVIGLLVWAVFWLSSFLTELLWSDGREAVEAILSASGVPLFCIPLAFCTFGGLIIGLWTWKMGGSPEPLEKVLATVKQTGGYRLERPLASVVGFLLPLVFGGSVGPEAGLTGIIAAACTRIGLMLKSAGLRVKGISDVTVSAALSAVFATPFVGVVATIQDGASIDADPSQYTFKRNVKLVLYIASAFGAVAGVALFTSVFGSEGGMPHFEGITPLDNKLVWAIPCLVFGYVGAFAFHSAEKVFAKASASLGDRPVLKPTIAGVALGALSIPLPYVLFSGESQAFQIMSDWQAMSATILLLTGFTKCLATPLCLNFGWRGGHFFPCIFSGIAAGYGIALLGGCDPMFCVAITTASLVSGIQRKPFVALALLLLCFPVSSIPWMGIACLIGASLPIPAALLHESHKPSAAQGASSDD